MTYQTALIVDDSKLARITLRKKLEQRGLSVEMAESGVQALELLANQTVDIVFMDHLMPELDGFETTKKIKANPTTANIPVIMCTGKEYEGYLEEARSIGATNILSKPPENDALELILAEAPQAAPSMEQSRVSSPASDVSSISDVSTRPDVSTIPNVSTTPDASSIPDIASQSGGLSESDVEALVFRLVNESLKESLSSEVSKNVSAELSNQHQQKLDQLNSDLTARLNALDGALQSVESKTEEQKLDTQDSALQGVSADQFNATQDTVGRLTSQMVDMDSRLDELTDKLAVVGESASQPPVLEPEGGVSLMEVTAENQALREELSALKQQLDALKASFASQAVPAAQNDGVSLQQLEQMRDELKAEMATALDTKLSAQNEATAGESSALAAIAALKQSMEDRLASQDALLAAGDNIPTLQPESAFANTQPQMGDDVDLNFDTRSDLQHQLLGDNSELKESLSKMKMLAGGGVVLAVISLLAQFVF